MNHVTNEPELSVGGLCVATALVLGWNKELLYILSGVDTDCDTLSKTRSSTTWTLDCLVTICTDLNSLDAHIAERVRCLATQSIAHRHLLFPR